MRLMREGEEAHAVGSELHSVRRVCMCVCGCVCSEKRINHIPAQSNTEGNIKLFVKLSEQAPKSGISSPEASSYCNMCVIIARTLQQIHL